MAATLRLTKHSGGIRWFICFAAALLFYLGCYAFAKTLIFGGVLDDAYMFARYARNFRSGLGVSWNLDGVHTYGLTSVPWMFFLLPLTYVIKWPNFLYYGSSIAAALAVATMAFGVCQNARTKWLSNPLVAIFGVCLPLVIGRTFNFQATSGMDTMLAVTTNACLIFWVIKWQNKPSLSHAAVVGLIAFITTAVRLDSGLSAILIPLLAWSAASPKRTNELFAMCGIPLLLIAGYLAFCQLYFGTALPLSFYAKSAHSYVGFVGGDSQMRYFGAFLNSAGLPVFILLILGTGEDARKAMIFVIPAILTVCYLFSVRQIMGSWGRFYFPQIPYLLIPALLTFDRIIDRGKSPENSRILFQAIVPKLAIVALVGALLAITERSRLRSNHPVPFPRLVIKAPEPLPKISWKDGMDSLTEILGKAIQGRGTIASSEVGWMGYNLPKVDIVDLVGLNDLQIGRFGFSMNYLLKRNPDFIWFPHSDYTGLNATIFSDPRLYRHYEVIPGAFAYGIAFRKDSSYRKSLESEVLKVWPKFYPGTDMADYVASLPSQ